MAPAQQGLGADRPAVGGVELGLVVQAELPLFDSDAQVLQQLQLLAGVAVHRRVEKAVAVFAGALGVVHRRVGIHQQFFGTLAVARVEGDTDAGGDLQVMVGHPERACDQADLTCRQSQGIIGFGQLHQQHELITADPRQSVLAAQVFAQAQGHVPQQQIAHVVTKGVVDRLETIQVDEHQGEAAALLLHPVHGLVDTISQQYPVGQSGEGVVQGQLGQFPVGQGQRLGQLGGAGFQARIENRRQQGDGQHRQGGDQHQIVQALAAQAVQEPQKLPSLNRAPAMPV